MEYRLHSRNPRRRQVKELKEEGYDVNEKGLDHIAPASSEHINHLGEYNFKDDFKLEENELGTLPPILQNRDLMLL